MELELLSNSLQLATIDPSSPSRPSSSSSPITSSALRSTPPSAHRRRSLITGQIYQFALGYPQTPPETSPVPEVTSDSWEKPETIPGGMGSFVFRWYVCSITGDIMLSPTEEQRFAASMAAEPHHYYRRDPITHALEGCWLVEG